jgi:hypothetical protein
VEGKSGKVPVRILYIFLIRLQIEIPRLCIQIETHENVTLSPSETWPKDAFFRDFKNLVGLDFGFFPKRGCLYPMEREKWGKNDSDPVARIEQGGGKPAFRRTAGFFRIYSGG